MDRGEIIKQAFLKVGDNNAFNDNKGDKYQVADGLLDMIIKNIAIETDFLFNAITVRLTIVGQNELGENKFNIPIDFLNIIQGNDDFRIEGEFIYSKSSNLYIQYCRKIDVTEVPEHMFNIIVIYLAKEISLAFNAYNSRYPFLQQQLNEEKRKIIYQQGFLYKPWEVE
ncbi:hypothetical protein [Fusobacterium polymorphum]|uniref:hypothetical protein n=1 Tax=Fusobacterium nucleatum subsp. polymorphum TaxID=76857 RepID=UPI0030098D13